MKHNHNVIDIDSCDALPYDQKQIEEVSANASKLGSGDLGWDNLIDKIKQINSS